MRKQLAAARGRSIELRIAEGGELLSVGVVSTYGNVMEAASLAIDDVGELIAGLQELERRARGLRAAERRRNPLRALIRSVEQANDRAREEDLRAWRRREAYVGARLHTLESEFRRRELARST